MIGELICFGLIALVIGVVLAVDGYIRWHTRDWND